MQWERHLADLLAGRHTMTDDPLDAGAQMVVTEPGAGGDEAFRAPLARHHRVENDDPHLIWIRPIIPGRRDPKTGEMTFNLNICRRRGLQWEQAEPVDGGIELVLTSGQRARIEPAAGPELEVLYAWDTFTLGALTAEEESALDALREDSWTGRFA
ncbi:hypothetical protein [Streptomonospora salina]|uniref:Uncharacterized protein n=1 Tax=Streptomonospora salina TaxID=104205 RepID=A0A841E6J6_9ACTN|nr:hypothetical protein [Streptomonospora salina]MBB5998785.1 hypothetical protein [Streptomonospora salina]